MCSMNRGVAPRDHASLAQRGELVVVDAVQRDRVGLDAQAGRDRGVDAGEHAAELAATGDGAKPIGVERVERDVDAGEARARERRRKLGEHVAVRGHHDLLDPGDPATRATSSTRPLRTVGSPPVSRILRTPRPANNATMRSSSSNEGSPLRLEAQRAREPSGMQYVQR